MSNPNVKEALSLINNFSREVWFKIDQINEESEKEKKLFSNDIEKNQEIRDIYSLENIILD